MARITWRNIEATDTSRQIRDISDAYGSLTNAFDKGIEIIKEQQDKERRLNTSKFLDQIYSIGDVGQMQEYISSGRMYEELKGFGNNIDREAIRGQAENRLNTLLGIEETINNRLDRNEAREARPIIMEAYNLASQDRFEEALEVASSGGFPVLGTFNEIMDLRFKKESHDDSLKTNAQSRAASRHSMEMSERHYNLKLSQLADKLDPEAISNSVLKSGYQVSDNNTDVRNKLVKYVSDVIGRDASSSVNHDLSINEDTLKEASPEQMQTIKALEEHLKKQWISDTSFQEGVKRQLAEIGLSASQIDVISNSEAVRNSTMIKGLSVVGNQDSKTLDNTIKDLNAIISKADMGEDFFLDYDNYNKRNLEFREKAIKRGISGKTVENMLKLFNNRDTAFTNIVVDGKSKKVPLYLSVDLLKEVDDSVGLLQPRSSNNLLFNLQKVLLRKGNQTDSYINHIEAKEARKKLDLLQRNTKEK